MVTLRPKFDSFSFKRSARSPINFTVQPRDVRGHQIRSNVISMIG